MKNFGLQFNSMKNVHETSMFESWHQGSIFLILLQEFSTEIIGQIFNFKSSLQYFISFLKLDKLLLDRFYCCAKQK